MKLAVFTTHPIQYQVPIFQELVRQGVDLEVVYASDHSVRGGFDKGFGQEVKWDIPLLEGYKNRFLKNRGKGPGVGGLKAYDCPEVRKTLEEISPDAVLIPGYNTWYYLQVIFAANRLGIPLFLRGNNKDGTGPIRSGWRTRLRTLVLKRLYRQFEGFFSIGSYMTRHYRAHGVPEEKITVTPYCNNSVLFEAQAETWLPRREESRRVLGIPDEAFVVVTSGRFIPWKRLDLVVDALGDCGVDVPVWLIAMGDGPMREPWLSRMQERLGGRFTAPGFVNQSELGRFYACGDLFVLPSDRYHETWGLVVNEAMAFGLPVVVSDGVGCREDLVEGKGTGSVFPAGDVKACSRVLERMSHDPALRRQQGTRAKKLIASYSVENNAKAIVEAVQSENGVSDE